MRRPFAALFTLIDPVVADHASSEEADATLRALGRAGYGRGMLAVVGQADASRASARLARELASAPTHWAASGLAWGVAWAALTAVATLAGPTGGTSLAVLALLGSAALLLHVAVAWRVVAPEPALALAAWPERVASGTASGQAGPRRFLVLVRGSRSDIALARTILAS